MQIFFHSYQERLEFRSQNLYIMIFMSEVPMTSPPPPRNLIVKNLEEIACAKKFLKLRHSTMVL